jgi:gas vesicle protein
MSADIEEPRDYGFVVGLLAGTMIGAGVMMWLAPRVVAEIRGRITDSAANLRRQASDQYDQAASRVSGAVDDLTRTVQTVRDDAADTVARSAREVERYAKAAKSDRG